MSPSMARQIADTIRAYAPEQLIVAGQLEGLASLTWTKRYLGGAALTIHVNPLVSKSYDLSFDLAHQLIEFPAEARDKLTGMLIMKCTGQIA